MLGDGRGIAVVYSHQGRPKWEGDILSDSKQRVKFPREFFHCCYLQKHAHWYWDHG